ncbi:molybdate ABC transporter substrate-binding protein [Vibrio sp. HA2012]|uniref:molybdate ABC transporter substrate-binding protein n=1 Tax=Vibrio sp. HA2012 TaxID=1971595 RepID=UPI000C2C9387|nr:molybdate ABC transporter substrate-binding protein [Vibrio sp. HA2012]PJC86082.1 molybdate ABC transporter substrate-binding protein [Vibrio sp. HA2012]
MKRITGVVSILAAVLSAGVSAEDVTVAVANNFYGPMQVIAKDFKQVTGDDVTLSTGSTGQLYAQIVNGAPFDVFLAADTKRPEKLEADNLATDRFTYAQGKLVLWSPDKALVNGSERVLLEEKVKHIALANPKLAPYGLAAQQAMEKLGIYSVLEPKFVMGKGLNPTYQFVVTGNADVGFLAMSQVYKDGQFADGSHWEIPADLYAPIKQDAVLLSKGQNNSAAKHLMDYLQSTRAKALIASFGYK